MAESNEIIINHEYVKKRLDSIIEIKAYGNRLTELILEIMSVSRRGSNYAENIIIEAALENFKHKLESVLKR